MPFVEWIIGATALAMALLFGSGPILSPAQASYVLTPQEVSGNVVATGSGLLDLSGLLGPFLTSLTTGQMTPSVGFIVTGPTSTSPIDIYFASSGLTGPSSFGSDSERSFGSSGSGDVVGLFASILFFSCQADMSPALPVPTLRSMPTTPSVALT